jgi:hypothetical protein
MLLLPVVEIDKLTGKESHVTLSMVNINLNHIMDIKKIGDRTLIEYYSGYDIKIDMIFERLFKLLYQKGLVLGDFVEEAKQFDTQFRDYATRNEL